MHTEPSVSLFLAHFWFCQPTTNVWHMLFDSFALVIQVTTADIL